MRNRFQRMFFVLLPIVLPLLSTCNETGDQTTGDEDVLVTDSDTTVTVSVLLNEIDCHNRDWVEIVNTGDIATDIGGWIIGDDPVDADHQYPLPAGTVVGPGAFVVIKQQKDTEPGFSFGLKCTEDFVYLMTGAKKVMDVVRIGDAPDGSTWGRLPNGTGTWQETYPTQGGPNQEPLSSSEALFDSGAINTVALTFSETALAALKSDPYTYVEGQVQVTTTDVKSILLTVGVRLKSGLSFQPIDEKPAFKLKMNEYVDTNRLFGLKQIGLNNMVQDPSMMREAVAYTIFRAAGVPAIRTGYATVTVNGAAYGLYTLTETYDDMFSDRYFEDMNHIYEGMGDLLPTEVANIEVDEGSNTDTTDLTALIAAINDTADENWVATVGALIDLNEFALFWAIENYIGQIDGYTIAANNYYLHSTDANYFAMLPWGTDRSFVEKPAFPTCDRVLCQRCAAITECAALYDTALGTVAAAAGTLELDTLITDIEATIAAAVAADTRKPNTVAEHETAVQALRDYLSGRPAEVEALNIK